MSSPYSTTINALDIRAKEFIDQTNSFIKYLEGRQVTIKATEKFHKNVEGIFKKNLEEITAVGSHIQRNADPTNVDLSLVEQLTGCEDKFKEQLNRFNDAVLTHFPTAKIPYGNPCIEDRQAIKKGNMPGNATHLRKIRGDGNCFLSSFLTRFLETLSEKKCIGKFIEFIYSDGMDAPELKEELVKTLFELMDSPSELEETLKNNHKVLPFIHYFRQLAAKWMKEEHEEVFEVCFRVELEKDYGVAINNLSYEKLIDKYVLTMGVDFSQPMIIALCRKLNFPVKIYRMSDFTGANALDEPHAFASFCLKDNHYFILYTPEDTSDLPIVFNPSSSVSKKKDIPVH